MNAIILDCETTGLDPKTDRIIELGAVLYSVRHRCIVSSFATLTEGDGNEAERINRIPAEAVRNAPPMQFAWNRLGEMIDWAECEEPAIFVAHRAEFDRSFLYEAAPKLAIRLPWVCSKFDIEWPMSKPGASCVEMALAHGVPVVSAHRALTDCMLIASTMDVVAHDHDLEAILARAMRPRPLFQALVSYDEREKAKAAGFGWDGATKRWTRRMAVEDTAALPFAVEEVA